VASLATPDDLANYLGLSTPPANAQMLLDLSSAAVCGFLGWDPAEQTVVDQVRDGTGTAVLLLPTMHLTAVTAVAEWDLAAGTWGPALVEHVDYGWSDIGILERLGRRQWPERLRSVRLSYTFGWAGADMPGTIKGVAMDAAVPQTTNPGQVRSESIGSYSVTYATPAGDGAGVGVTLTRAQEDSLRRYRIAGAS